ICRRSGPARVEKRTRPNPTGARRPTWMRAGSWSGRWRCGRWWAGSRIASCTPCPGCWCPAPWSGRRWVSICSSSPCWRSEGRSDAGHSFRPHSPSSVAVRARIGRDVRRGPRGVGKPIARSAVRRRRGRRLGTLRLAQASHPQGPPRGEVQEHKPAPIPDSEKPRATGRGVTLGKQEAAPGARGARQHPEEGKAGEAHEEGGIAEQIFHHVADEVWVPLGFWIGAHHIDLSITTHVINMWIAAGILLLVLAAAVRRRPIVPTRRYNLLETFVMFVRDEIAEKNIGHEAPRYTPYLCSAFFFILFMNLTGLLPIPSIAGKFPG